jgi:hypothetical protein
MKPTGFSNESDVGNKGNRKIQNDSLVFGLSNQMDGAPTSACVLARLATYTLALLWYFLLCTVVRITLSGHVTLLTSSLGLMISHHT